MEMKELPINRELVGAFPYDAIVVLPYTRREREVNAKVIENNRDNNVPGPRTTHRLSHFSSRGILAGLELYREGKAPYFILPGEQKDPSTCDLEEEYLVRKGVAVEQIFTFPNRNGTAQQLDPVLALQKAGELGKVLIVSFEFHKGRVGELIKAWGINADVAEVETTHAKFQQEASQGKSHTNREQLINLPQLDSVKRAEHGIPRLLNIMDKPFGQKAPASRGAKFIMGTTITDIDKTTLVRLEKVKKYLRSFQQKLSISK